MDILLENPLPSIASLVILVLGAKHLLLGNRSSNPPFPPSPPSHFILGHAKVLFQAAGNEEYAFYELGKKYGGIVYLNVLGAPMVILNDVKIAAELLDQRGSVFSSRPTFAISELMGYTQAAHMLPYGSDWRIHRRIFQRYFNPTTRNLHQPIQLREARSLLKNILAHSSSSGREWEHEILRFSTTIIISISYGHDIKSEDDPYFKIADDMFRKVVPAMKNVDMINAGIIEVFPLIQYFPSWFPGAAVAVQARRAKRYVRSLYEFPITDVEEKMNNGKAQPSFLATQLEEFKTGESGSDVTLEHIKGSSATVYTAGTETTASVLLTLIGALVLHPDVQTKAQAEIDRVVGTDRLPEFSDREKMPYLQCVVDELGRWQPVAPVQPRKSTEDDVYEGMFIPKGTTVIVNARGMGLDESVYKEPTKFNPDRFLPVSEGGNGEPSFEPNFGFGRRICPGRYLAQDSIWIVAAHLLATMNLLPVAGEQVRWEFSGTVNHPAPFKCKIVPRSEKAKELIDRVEL